MHGRVETTHTREPTHAHTQADPAMETYTQPHITTPTHRYPIRTHKHTRVERIFRTLQRMPHTQAHGSTQALFALISGSILIVFYTYLTSYGNNNILAG